MADKVFSGSALVEAEGIVALRNITVSDLPTPIVIPALTRVTLTAGNSISDINASAILANAWTAGFIRLYFDGVIVDSFPPLSTPATTSLVATPQTAAIAAQPAFLTPAAVTSGAVEALGAVSSRNIVVSDLPFPVIIPALTRVFLTGTGNSISDINSSAILTSSWQAGYIKLFVGGTLVTNFPPLSVAALVPIPAVIPPTPPVVFTPGGIDIASVGGIKVAAGQAVMAASFPVAIASDQVITLSALTALNSPTYVAGKINPFSMTTDGNLRVAISSGADRTAVGTILTTETVSINTQGAGSCSIQISGTWTGTIVFEYTVDGVIWNVVPAVIPTTGASVTSATANGGWVVACASFNQVRARGNTVAGAGATVNLESSLASSASGVATVGVVTQGGAPWSQNITQVGGVAVSLGQKAMAASFPVVIASDQSTVPISAVSLPLPAGAATEATLLTRLKPSDTLTAVTTVAAVTAITNALPTGANVIGHVISDAGSTTAVTGVVTVAGNKTNNAAAPGATNIGVLPVVATAAVPVYTEGNLVAASVDLSGNLRTVTAASSTTAVTYPANSITLFTVLAANPLRLGATIYNDSAGTVLVKLGPLAGVASFTVKMLSQAYFEIPFRYTGVITAIAITAVGNLAVTEITL